MNLDFYDFDDGWYVTSSPITSADLESSGGDWPVPVGGGLGRVMKIDKLPVNLMLGAYYNIIRPDLSATWQLRSQMTFVF